VHSPFSPDTLFPRGQCSFAINLNKLNIDLKHLCSHRESQIVLLTLLCLQKGFIIVHSYAAISAYKGVQASGWAESRTTHFSSNCS